VQRLELLRSPDSRRPRASDLQGHRGNDVSEGRRGTYAHGCGPCETTRGLSSTRPSPTRVDLWWSGEHAAHGGNVQVVAAPDSWRIWTSDARPGREHDTTARRAHAEVLRLLDEWTDHTHAALADLGYEGERRR
jgi:hypothetical protein